MPKWVVGSMAPAKKIHDASRQYCIDRSRHWNTLYGQLIERGGDRLARPDGGWDYSAAALDTFSRYNVLAAIRSEIERFDPVELGALDDAREMLMLAGETAQNAFTRDVDGAIERAAIGAERQAFVEFVRGLTPEAIATAKELPYRRVLSAAETRARFDALSTAWGSWYGGAVDRADLPPFSTLQASRLDDARLGFIRELIRSRVAASHVWELREFDDSYEVDLDLVHLSYTGAEGFWTAPPLDWLVYASHEDSLTVGGAWLRDALRAAWPDWRDLLYRNYHGNDEPWTE